MNNIRDRCDSQFYQPSNFISESKCACVCVLFHSHVWLIDVRWYGTRHNRRQSDYVIQKKKQNQQKKAHKFYEVLT